MYSRESINNVWEGYMKPFKIIGNVYFVGTYQASSHLIDTGDGLILIDTGYFNTLYLLLESIRELGFNPHDIKYILHSHWHNDHTAATKYLVKLIGAKTFIGIEDAEYLKQNDLFIPDVLIRDGDVISLGNTSIRCLETPGHTKGTVSFIFDVIESNDVYTVGMFGGAGANSLIKSFPTYYEGCREDYLTSIQRLIKEKVDVFIGNHTWNNDTKGKRAKMISSCENPFINPNEWVNFLNFCKKRLENLE